MMVMVMMICPIQLLQGVCDKHPFDSALRNRWNNPQLLDHRRLPCLEGGETFLGYFPSNFWFETAQVFSVLLADGHRTNGDRSDNQCDNITGRGQSKNQISDIKFDFRFSFLQVSSQLLILLPCWLFLERSFSPGGLEGGTFCFAVSFMFDLVIN